ncbi:outer membrane beta-barrel protein [Pedobacter arcticus]|uniref:outer membrane beta-barrel protein n=1 Tax=Pedobacter arcticus TaxID=752140 RepID=UPI000377EC35|nr:outer membrane beta-barrel protein [Pedobacter arcticus]
MKKIYLIAIVICMAQLASAQTTDSVKTDSITIKKGNRTHVTIEAGPVKVSVGERDSSKKVKKPVTYPNLTYGLTFEHFDIGLSMYHTGSEFGAPNGYALETDTWKTSNIGFDVLQLGLRFSPNVKVMLAAGLDWNHMRLKQNVTIEAEQPALTITQEAIKYSKNRFSSRYLRVPLYFEYRSPENKKGKRASVVFGPEIGFLLDGKVKQVSKENGKEKFKDDFNLEPFRYGANIRIGYGGAGLFFKYYMNDVFAKGQGPADYKNLNFGLTLGF